MSTIEIKLPSIKLKGRYKIEAVSADGSKRLLVDWFDNLITNNGLDLMGGYNGWLAWCSVGSGNATPAYTDTALQTYVDATSNIISRTPGVQSSSPYYGTLTSTYQFPIGAFPSGANLSEVGIGYANNGTNLFSRALILDGMGNPTTITILATEALNVTYQLNYYVPTADSTGTTSIAGVGDISWTCRAALATNVGYWGLYSGDQQMAISSTAWTDASLQGVTGSIQGSQLGGPISDTQNSYTPGSYTCSNVAYWSLAYGNSADGITGFQLTIGPGSGSGIFQMVSSPTIPKDNTTTLTMSFSYTWGRY